MAAYVSAAAQIYGMYLSYQQSRNQPPTPQSTPQGNFTTYDQNGNITGQQTYDPVTGNSEYHAYADGVGKEPVEPKAKDLNPSDYSVRYTYASPNGDYIEKTWTPGDTVGTDLSEDAKIVIAQAQATWDKAEADNKIPPEQLAQYEQELAAWQEKKDGYDNEQAATKKILKDAYADASVSWDDRLARYDSAVTTFSDQQHAQLDPQLAKAQRTEDQRLADRGMTGSRAAVDTQAALAKTTNEANEEISRNASMYGYTLADSDLQRTQGTINMIKGGQNADTTLALQGQSLAAQAGLQGNQLGIARDVANNNAAYQRWLTQYQQRQGMVNTAMGTASGLAYLYGYNKPSNANSGSYSFPWSAPASTTSNYAQGNGPLSSYGN